VWSGGGVADVFRCHVCGARQAKQEFTTEVFRIDGKAVLVEGIPATVCTCCGEAAFGRETTERIRRMLHGEAKPVRAEVLEVYTYV
jgi:HTH-type transcriptional regulator / antitoxin MqsA